MPWVVVSVLTNAACVAGGGTTVNVTGLLVPPAVVTVMTAGPSGAVAGTKRVAVIWLAVATTPVAVIPAGRLRAAPFRLAPVSITSSLVPITPAAGVMPASTGVSGLIVKATALVKPPGVVTVRVCVPCGALMAMLKLAVIWLAVMTTPVTVMPASGLRVAPVKLVPVRVTGTIVPITPRAGVTAASVGGRKVITVESVVLAVNELPPDTLTALTCGDSAMGETLTLTVIGE